MAEHGNQFSLYQLSNTSEDEPSDHNAVTINGDHGASGWSCPHHHKPPPSSADNDDDNDNHYHLLPPPQKKPRGRPVGSKNKPKEPIIITQDHEELLKPVVIKIAIGLDVMESLKEFARKRNVGISVLSGSGSIASVTLHHPLLSSPSFTLHGPFTLLSLTGTYFSGPSHPSFPSFTLVDATSSSALNPNYSFSITTSSFGISLLGSQGEIFGGVVAGKIVAGSTVTISATMFKNPEFYKVGFDENDEGGVGEKDHHNLNARSSNFVNQWGHIHSSTRPRNY
ncbi:hypothetical protein TanjilG_28963 [Lupinus angustifolius]|uniref:PPC domain-containing protein n=1 Tax=Lupinus angustifolius TaxID=3871 RepID=A0A4P1RTB2_LUPAN|nr:PREDICTED: AT-hook motif nuclear-localized protein 28-like [Lupinus angustifolius]OIW17613.1 hypothetical protein TanjilG_28963 [Lupinus angustifolius]